MENDTIKTIAVRAILMMVTVDKSRSYTNRSKDWYEWLSAANNMNMNMMNITNKMAAEGSVKLISDMLDRVRPGKMVLSGTSRIRLETCIILSVYHMDNT